MVKVNVILPSYCPENGYGNISPIVEKQATYGTAKPRNPKWHVRDQITVHLDIAAVKDRCIGFHSNISKHFDGGTRSCSHNRVGIYPRVSLNSLLIRIQLGQPMEFVNTIN